MWPRRRSAFVLGVLGLGCDRAAPEPAPEPGVGAAASAVAARAAPGATRRAQAPPAASAAASAAPHIKSVVSPPDGAASAGRSGGTRPPPLELPLPPSQRHEPTGLAPGQRRPLLVFLHGLGSSGRFAFEGLGLGELGRRERVFIVAPDGSTDAAGDVTEGPGTALNVVLRFDTRDALYLEGVTDVQELDTLTPAEIVSRLVPTDMWSRERPTNFGHTPIHEGSVEIRFAE